MIKRRYEAWARHAHPDWIKAVFGDVDELEIDAIWPIVDTKTCGEIDGMPKPSQFFCVAFDCASQSVICDALNRLETESDGGEDE